MSRQIKINAFTQGKLIHLMLDGDLDCRQLAEATGLHYVTVLQYARELHRAKAAFICRWDADELGRHCIKVYKIGKGRDAKRPRLTPAQRQAAYKERQKRWSSGAELDAAIRIKAYERK